MSKAKLKLAIAAFKPSEDCSSPNIQGSCDLISLEFLRFCKTEFGIKGILLAADNPVAEPTDGFIRWSGCIISHYVAYFPRLKTIVDWTARQFWHDCTVPIVQTDEEFKSCWKDLPYGFENSLDHE